MILFEDELLQAMGNEETPSSKITTKIHFVDFIKYLHSKV